MIASLSGTLRVKTPTEILVDVNGVGYGVLIPLSTFEKLGDLNAHVTLFTYLHVREDALQLYGFATEEERFLFKLLISVSGIGPKIAQGILSGISVADMKSHIAKGDLAALTAIPGVGKKTAERLIIELRDKVGKLAEQVPSAAMGPADQEAGMRQEALLALTSLGYNRQVAEKAIRQVLNESAGTGISLQDLIKRALRYTSPR
jgi:Holliday junction DNA helicase RuvA